MSKRQLAYAPDDEPKIKREQKLPAWEKKRDELGSDEAFIFWMIMAALSHIKKRYPNAWCIVIGSSAWAMHAAANQDHVNILRERSRRLGRVGSPLIRDVDLLVYGAPEHNIEKTFYIDGVPVEVDAWDPTHADETKPWWKLYGQKVFNNKVTINNIHVARMEEVKELKVHLGRDKDVQDRKLIDEMGL